MAGLTIPRRWGTWVLPVLPVLWVVAPRGGTSFLVQQLLSSTVKRAPLSLSSTVSSWQSHISTHPHAASALQKILEDASIATIAPDLAFLFVAQFHASHFESLVQTTSAALPPTTRLVSIVGGGVIGDQVEIDEPSQPGLSLLMGNLPHGLNNVDLFTFNELTNPPPPVEAKEYWNIRLRGTVDSSSSLVSTRSASVLLFADPWSPVEHVIQALSIDQQGSSPVTIAGGITVPTGTGSTLALDKTCLPQGSLLGVCFHPTSHVQMQVVVAQGCRPVGPAYRITASQDNIVLELDGQPALGVLENLLQNIASQTERNAISSGLLCGIHSLQTDNVDDYLIRQILGFVPSKGGVVVAGLVQDSNILRFHVRDKTTATEDLDLMVQRVKTERLFRTTGSTNNNNNNGSPLCALQVSCVARGRSFFGEPNVDIARTKLLLQSNSKSDRPTTAVGGFYANGEIGPVGIAGMTTSATLGSTNGNGGTFLHGFTTVMAMLVDMSNATSTESNSPDENIPFNEETTIWG